MSAITKYHIVGYINAVLDYWGPDSWSIWEALEVLDFLAGVAARAKARDEFEAGG